jgi:hypothetical protein
MPWVTFTDRFKWSPPELNGTWSQVFPGGYVGNVTTPCTKAAIAAGKAVPAKPTRAERGDQGQV